MKVLLVGSGGMALAYQKVLASLAVDLTVVGRGEASAAAFEKACGHEVMRGGVRDYLARRSGAAHDAAVVSVGVDMLAPVTHALLRAGLRRILVEKPAALEPDEVPVLAAAAEEAGADVFVAYNRRFYGSVRRAREIIADDGGVKSFQFEFTEWAHQIAALKTPPEVKRRWLLANSTHVIDLAFHLGGAPTELQCLHRGGLDWHPNASVFAGCGVTDQGALFSYGANWAAPGRWGVEVCTSRHRLIFRPMETLQVMDVGSVAIRAEPLLDGDLDKDFKPGLMLQVRRFLDAGAASAPLCTLREHSARVPFYCEIAGYRPATPIAGGPSR